LPKRPREDYYAGMLDLEGMDPTLAPCGRPAAHRERENNLLRELFRLGRLDWVNELAEGGFLAADLAEKVGRAVRIKEAIFLGLKGVTRPDVERLGPRALALKELGLFHGQVGVPERYPLAVELPVRRDWRRRKVAYDRPRSVLRFYRVTRSYVWELMAANNAVETLYNYSVTIEKMARLGISEFLDYGAGIGSLVIAAARADLRPRHMDLASPTLDFARWRYKNRRLGIEMLEARGDHGDLPFSPAIVCTEVVEHVPDPLRLLDALREAVPKGGHLVISESCRYTEKFIAHLPSNRWLGGRRFDHEMGRRGFREVFPRPRVHPRVFVRFA